MSDKHVIPFPGRAASAPVEAKALAEQAVQNANLLMEEALLKGDAPALEGVLLIYERDVLPYLPWFNANFAYSLCQIGERLQRVDLLKRGVTHYNRMFEGDFPGSPETEERIARMRGEAGFALLWLAEFDPANDYTADAITQFETALLSWRACLQFDCVRLSAGLGLAQLAAVARGSLSLLDAATNAIAQAIEFSDENWEGPYAADVLYAAAALALRSARAGRSADISAALTAANDAITIYRNWKPGHVITPARIARVERVRDDLSALQPV